jgi:L-alanine-DL-glutamate epimerase-like enolase superfamily enzyme
MRPGMGPEQDLEAVRQMRKATDSGFQLMVDAHTWWRMGDRSYSLDTVRQLAADMAGEDITWLEEPIPPDDHDGYRRLYEERLVPLATGEHEPTEDSFLDLLTGPCADYIQMDLICQGGYSVAQRLLSAIEGSKLRFAFHSWGTALELMAAGETVEWLEYPCYKTDRENFMYPFPLAMEIIKEPLRIDRGELIVPSAPGLGVTVNEAVIDKYPWIPGPWSEFTLISPKQTFAVTSDHSVKWAGERVA